MERLQQSRLIDQVTVIDRREGGLVEAYVPLSLIFMEDVPTDQTHVLELASSIESETNLGKRTGQLLPALLGEIHDFEKFLIIDGFHRASALAYLDRNEIFATIRPNCSWEEIIDLRILSATTHRSVKFARLIEWIEEAWSYTPYSKKIKSSQAFEFMCATKMTGTRIGLSHEEVEEIKNWVENKCSQWHMSAPYVYRYLHTAQLADPELVKEARDGRSGSKLEAITPNHLSAMARALPYKYEFQRLVAEAAKANILTVSMTKLLATLVAKSETTDKARELIESRRWRSLNLISDNSLSVKESGSSVQSLIESLFQAELKIAELTIENAILTGRYQPLDEIKENILVIGDQDDMDSKTSISESSLGQPFSNENIGDLIYEINELKPEMIAFLKGKFGVDPEDGNDIFESAVLKTLMSIKNNRFTYRDKPQLRSWMYKVTKSVAIDRYRKLRHELRQKKREDSKEKEIQEEHVGGDSEEYLKAFLPYLNEKQRRVFVLREFYRLSFFNIAQITGETLTGVKALLQRAKGNMTKVLVKELSNRAN